MHRVAGQVGPVDLGGARGGIGSGVPDGVGADLVVGVVVDGVGNPPDRGDFLGWRAQGVDFRGADQVQAAAGGRGPAGGESGKVSKLGILHMTTRIPDHQTVVIVTQELDPHAEAVLGHLASWGINCVRLHPATLLRDWSMDLLIYKLAGWFRGPFVPCGRLLKQNKQPSSWRRMQCIRRMAKGYRLRVQLTIHPSHCQT